MPTPLPLIEVGRVLILNDAASGIGIWKADDAAQTHVLITRAPEYDPDDNSVFLVDAAGTKTYLGTTGLGKDGIAGVTVDNAGRIFLWVPEAAKAGDPGASADLYRVELARRLTAEPAPAATGTVDTTARALIKQLAAAVVAALTPFTK